MPTLVNSLDENFEFRNNIVIQIDGTYFAKYQPDSGLVIDDKNLLVDDATINPTQIDLRRAITQVNSTTVRVLDGINGDYTFSAFMGADDNALVDKEISIFFGRVDEDMPFSEYIEINKYIINNIDKSGNHYNIKAKSQEDKTLKPSFEMQGTLDLSIIDTTTTVVVETDEDIFPSSGIIKIENEYLEYSSTSFLSGITTFTVSNRGHLDSTAIAHENGSQVNYVEELIGNPIELILQLLISKGGGGAYDLLADGAGIDNSLVDIAGFENIRDTFFPLDQFTLYASDLNTTIDFIETELLVPNNIRIIKNTMNNLISLAILDQSDPAEDVEEINEDVIVKDSEDWNISKDGLQTVVKVQWNWSEGQQKYLRSKTFKAEDSIIATFGEISGPNLKFKGVQDVDNGENIVEDRARRYLLRFGTPRASVKLRTFMKTFKHNIGDKVRVNSNQLPQQGGGRGMSSIIEIVNRAVNTSTGIISLGFRFTSYTNIRNGLISPSQTITAITSQQEFSVADASRYKAGYVLKLWDKVNREYKSDAANTIASVDGNVITMENEWSTILTTDFQLFFADYNESSAQQRAIYAYIVGNTNFFEDDTKGYQIIL